MGASLIVIQLLPTAKVEQRAYAIKRRKELWEMRHPACREETGVDDNSGTSCPTIPERGRGRPKEFASDTAERTGQSKKDINRHVSRAEALGNWTIHPTPADHPGTKSPAR